eukprot:TRINITY_DN18817_c0_g1_i1.p1 TRINITY_DN18817_c0_g1~~TRINITY_DN18817_c0_g1_i1.p1  ORF type:complete len:176 (-),score=39.67 TRINITY_DN18817_c0_g1_i1:565-1092(-)
MCIRDSTYEMNFGKDVLFGDVIDVAGDNVPDLDLLTGGFPCQPFSCRGDQHGFEDSRGLLYKELLRLLVLRQPAAFLFENVSGLLTMGATDGACPGPVFAEIISGFEDVGYDVEWKLVDALHWLPQTRERLYMVGFRKDVKRNPMAEPVTCKPVSTVREMMEDHGVLLSCCWDVG